MPWPIRMTTHDEFIRVYDEQGAHATIGMAFEFPSKRPKSPDYKAHRDGKPVVMVILPPGGADGKFVVDWIYGENQAWVCSGEWPNVTITPSINCPGSYHGWIRDGVITDDCEGRTFPCPS